MICPICGENMRAPWTSKSDSAEICRYRRCRCGYSAETREISDDGGYPDSCPVCRSKTWVYRTIKAGAGVVVRVRECTMCPARFYTSETILRVTRLPADSAKNEL